MTRPAPERLSASGVAAWPRLFSPPIAHRGLWRPGGAPENSLAAFEAACFAGYGIELDVRLSAGGEAVVFHDAALDRLTEADGPVEAREAAELGSIRLAGTDQTIPTLGEVLTRVAGRALVLIELKTPLGREGPMESRVAELLDGYDGPAAVIGFNPLSHAWFAEHRPGFLRGLNSHGYADAAGMDAEHRRALANFEHVETARPHFLLPGLDVLQRPALARLREQGLPAVAWTIRSEAQREAVAPYCDNFIFEGFAP